MPCAAGQLPERGQSYIVADHVLGVLSLPAVSVWTNGRVVWWRTGEGEVTWPAADAPGAARTAPQVLGLTGAVFRFRSSVKAIGKYLHTGKAYSTF